MTDERRRPRTNAPVGVLGALRSTPREGHLALAAVVVVSVLVGLGFAVLVPEGQPYDEPAHVLNVDFYADHHRMPELGEPGASYESQMGPGYYAPAAVVRNLTAARPNDAIGVRVAGVILLFPLLAISVAALTSVLLRDRSRWRPPVVAAGFITLNPFIVAIGASVQNDYLTMVLCSWAMVWIVGLFHAGAASRTALIRRWCGVGILLGAATLTKLYAIAAIPAVLVGSALAPRNERRPMTRGAILSMLVAGTVTGWWFVRNIVVYGDPIGRGSIAESGAEFAPLRFTGISSLGSWGQSLFTHAWLPTEYYRNVFHAPSWLRILTVLAAATIAAALATAVIRWGRRLLTWTPVRATLLTWAVLTFTAYAVIAWTSTGLGPRFLFAVWPTAAATAVAVMGRTGLRQLNALATATTATTLAVALAWTAFEISRIPTMPYWL